MRLKITMLALALLTANVPTGCASAPRQKAPPGFQLLFSGRGLMFWRGRPADPPAFAKMSKYHQAVAQRAADTHMHKHWRVIDGILTFDGQGDGICTTRDFRDFDLLIDWRIPKGGDSGIYIRGVPQVQIWDNPVGSGGLYNNRQHPSAPLAVADKPPGEWNTFRIHVVGDRVTVHLNDVLVVDDTPMENAWERGKPLPEWGPIELQAHGGPLEFRNIFIRELNPFGRTPEPATTQPADVRGSP